MLAARMRPVPITALSLCNGMGLTTAEIVEALRAGRSGLGSCPPEIGLTMPATVGAVRGELPPLPARFAAHDTRLTRIAARALAELGAPLARARARWGRDRIAVLLGTSTGGIGESELRKVVVRLASCRAIHLDLRQRNRRVVVHRNRDVVASRTA